MEQLRRHGAQLARVLASGSAEYQQPAKEGGHGGAQRVESLCQVEPAGSCARRAQHRDVRIGRNLQRGDAGGKNDQRRQEQRERKARWRRG